MPGRTSPNADNDNRLTACLPTSKPNPASKRKLSVKDTHVPKKLKRQTKEENGNESNSKLLDRNDRPGQSDSHSDNNDNTAYLYCNGLHKTSSVSWIMCELCHCWADNSCAGVGKNDKHFVCEICL